MLVRLVEEYRRGDLRVPAGGVLDVGAAEAILLSEDGSAVPVTNHDFARETR